MYTAYIKQIDGIDVVLGVDSLKIDPVATQIKVKPLIEATKEAKAVAFKFDKIKELTLKNQELRRQGKRIYERVSNNKFKQPTELLESDFTSTELESLKKYDSEIKSNEGLIKVVQGELKSANEALKVKSKELAIKEGVYFKPSENEIIIDQKTFNQWKQKIVSLKTEKKFLCKDGSIITDFRNKKFFSKIDGVWESLEPKFLSDQVNLEVYRLESELTKIEKEEINEQFEADRIKNLTAEEKANEVKMLTESAMQQSINMKSRLEIEGDSKAIEKSQKFYQEQVDLINVKYS